MPVFSSQLDHLTNEDRGGGGGGGAEPTKEHTYLVFGS
jgi:hypothetical protein